MAYVRFVYLCSYVRVCVREFISVHKCTCVCVIHYSENAFMCIYVQTVCLLMYANLYSYVCILYGWGNVFGSILLSTWMYMYVFIRARVCT